VLIALLVCGAAFKEFHAIDARVMLDRQTQRSRGFGFVHFAAKEDMEDAVHGLHGTEIDSRKISVTRAIPQSETAPGTPAAALARGPSRYRILR
jgi:RNA recognition motif-containing protein